jgi:hypothetical protein
LRKINPAVAHGREDRRNERQVQDMGNVHHPCEKPLVRKWWRNSRPKVVSVCSVLQPSWSTADDDDVAGAGSTTMAADLTAGYCREV